VLLFCDTSALIKLLIDEPDSAQIHQITERAGLIASCRITWAEAMAAMARRQRDDPTSADEIENARQRLSMLWLSFTIVEVTPSARKVDASPSRPFSPQGGLMEPFNASLQRDRKS